MSNIDKRVSLRMFDDKEVSDEVLKDLVKAGMAAPSSKNKQPWQFIVLTRKELIEEFGDFHQNWNILKRANKVIIVCGDLSLDERETHTVMACSAATQNILLRCVEHDLGSVWIGCYPDKQRLEFIKNRLSLPETVFPLSLIAVGYPKQPSIKERQYKAEIVHFNQW